MKLRHRVHGTLDADSFMQVGARASRDIMAILKDADRDLSSFTGVLDFGCGCGRVLRYLRGRTQSRFHGTDIDPEAIAWCRAHLPGLAQWDVNSHEPPLRYQAGAFDLIYAVSVFTHLDEARQFTWLEELRRVTKPGGLLILTVHGAAYDGKVAMPERGILHKVRKTGMFRPGGLPDYYQSTYHTQRYVENEWSRFFTIRDYRERGMNNHQDAVLLRRD